MHLFVLVCIVIITTILSIAFILLTSAKFNSFNVNTMSIIRPPSLNNGNFNKSLSTVLIYNGIYPRYINLTNIIYDTDNIPYNDISAPLFITMADMFYIPALRNFHFQLQKYGLQNNLIVLCLDYDCVKLCQSNNLLTWESSVNASVARTKVGFSSYISQFENICFLFSV